MKKTIILITLCCLLAQAHAQTPLQKIADKVFLAKSKINNQELDSLYQAIKFYRDFEHKEKALNGGVRLGFAGNESDLNNLFKINTGIEMDNGLYPFELDLRANFQTVIQNGAFQENISDIDVSFDYHPKVGNGLWLENYVFLSRFNNTYLGIDQRYETGAGIILNYFSTARLTETGQENDTDLKKLPAYNLEAGNFWKCYADNCSLAIAGDALQEEEQITERERKYIEDVRYNYDKANKKRHAKFRLGLLMGIYYENEKAKAETRMLFNGVVDSLFSIDDFEGTNKLRWQLRPTLVFKPDEIFTISLYPYFKFPLTKWYDEVRYDENIVDRRVDQFFDWQATVVAKITKSISCTLQYRYMKDFAPKRKYILDEQAVPQLIVGQETHSFYSIAFGFSF